MPTRQAFILQAIHDRSHATNAIALNSLTFNGARLVGPAVAGAVLALIGETACFAVNTVSYVAAIYMLLARRPRAVDPDRRRGSLREAIQYVERFPPARWLLITVAAASWGPGYRVYYARAGVRIVVLLLGGDKRKQQADIDRAKEYWRDYHQRTKAEGKGRAR